MDKTVFSSPIRGATSVLALNPADNQLIAAGQQNFQLFSIVQIDNTEKFVETYDFRNSSRQPAVSRWCALQPKDVAWNPKDENCFATASGTSGYLYIWDVNRLVTVSQLNIHNAIINRIVFHPSYRNVLLTASQDGFAKLIDYRINSTDKIVRTFRHSSKEGFRDIDINGSNTDKFAAVVNDQYSVPIWDIRQPSHPEFSVLTRDKVLSIAWNPHEPSWLATGGTGGHDRTIRVWDAKGNDSRQEPLFTVYTFGQVPKLSWRPTSRHHIACFTRTTDQRIHVWDVRRAYLPQFSFCHHRNDIEDFLWRPNSDNIISVSRDERLIHAPISSAIKSEQLISFISLNVTSKGSVHISMPNIDNDYVQSLYAEGHVPLSSSSLQKFYSQETMSSFINWNKMIRGKTILGIYKKSLNDDSIRSFHMFARKWIFGNGDRSLIALAHICDVNSDIADELNRPDLKATWQVIKMLYTDYRTTIQSSKNSRSVSKGFQLSDSMNNPRHNRRHHHYHQSERKLTSIDKQQDYRLNDDFNDEKRVKTQEQKNKSNSKLEMIDDADTYIVRDVLTDDLIFVTPEDILNHDNTDDNYLDIETMRDSFLMSLENINGNSQSTRQWNDLIFIDDDEDLDSEDELENINANMQTSTHSIIPDGSDKFFTIDESYCPTLQKFPFNFDDIIRQTLWYYVENNELQVAVHLLLALCPQLTENKRIELFNGAHLQWLIMYIELLQKMRLFVKAKQVTKHCVETEGVPLLYNSTEYDGTIILTAQAPTFKRLPQIASPSTNSTSKNLAPILKEFVCSICRIPCRGLFSFCGVCSHGGHIEHIENWFKTHFECPYGCGHRCTDRDSQNRRGSISHRFTSKPPVVFQ